MFKSSLSSVTVISVVIFIIGFGLSLLILPVVSESFILEIAFVFMLGYMVYFLFDRLIWQWSIWRYMGIIKVPVLKGYWTGKLTSSFDNKSNVYPVTIHIKQTWRSIRVELQSKTSTSMSLAASIQPYDATHYQLSYTYITYPYADVQKDGIVQHTGLCNLLFDNERKELGGHYHYYYEDEQRQDFIHGNIVVKRT